MTFLEVCSSKYDTITFAFSAGYLCNQIPDRLDGKTLLHMPNIEKREHSFLFLSSFFNITMSFLQCSNLKNFFINYYLQEKAALGLCSQNSRLHSLKLSLGLKFL